MSFKEMNLDPLIVQAISAKEYEHATPIQEKAIPPLLEGRDLLGCAHTGTGKTAAFAIPILQKLSEEKQGEASYTKIKALVLAPTRELAIQIGESFKAYGQFMDHYTGVIFGGVTPKRHIKVLKREPSILVATPGRLLDLASQGYIDFSELEFLVLDEADRMLDMGMIQDVKEIINHLPKSRQNMLFSATMPKDIEKLANSILRNPVKVQVKSKPKTREGIRQLVYFVEQPEKTELLFDLIRDDQYDSVLVFTRTKLKADKVAKQINAGHIRTKAFHGDKNQSERMKALELFKSGEIKVLVATDVAARGIDISGISLVVNMDVPNVAETYVHRIGRTGRAGKKGTSITLCNNKEKEFLNRIEELQGFKLEVVKDHGYLPLKEKIKENRRKYGSAQRDSVKKRDNQSGKKQDGRKKKGDSRKKSISKSKSRPQSKRRKR